MDRVFTYILTFNFDNSDMMLKSFVLTPVLNDSEEREKWRDRFLNPRIQYDDWDRWVLWESPNTVKSYYFVTDHHVTFSLTRKDIEYFSLRLWLLVLS